MIKTCNVQCALLYAGTVSELLNMAKKDVEVERVLKGMHELCHTGWTLPKEDEEWGFDHGINLVVSRLASSYRVVWYMIDCLLPGYLWNNREW